MACLTSLTEEVADIYQKITAKSASSEITMKKKGEIIPLKRGGVVVKTKLGWIQFGIPPETVKDSLNLGIEVPSYYVVPTVRFDKKTGINLAEFEFPAYFNYFVKKRKINLICSKDAFDAIRIIFQETLLGPLSFDVLCFRNDLLIADRTCQRSFIIHLTKARYRTSKRNWLTSPKRSRGTR